MSLADIEQTLQSTPLPTKLSSPKAGVVLISPRGSFDMSGTHYIQAAFKNILDEGYNNVILDMAGVNYASSMGIGAITELLKNVSKKGGKLILLDIQPKVLDVFSLLGFTSFLTIANSLDDAVKAI